MPGAAASLGGVHGRVGRAEVHGMGGDVLDAAARPDGLVVDGRAAVLVVFLEPLQVQRGGEGRARAVDLRLRRRAAEDGQAEGGEDSRFECFRECFKHY